MGHGGGDAIIYVLQGASILIALVAVVLSTMTFFRYDKWRKDDKTEITIKEIDHQARDGVKLLADRFETRANNVDARFEAVTKKLEAEVESISNRMSVTESELRNSIQQVDSRLRTQLASQASQLSAIAERLKHIPTQADIVHLTEALSGLSGAVAANGAKTDGLASLVTRIDNSVQRIEEHHFRGG